MCLCVYAAKWYQSWRRQTFLLRSIALMTNLKRNDFYGTHFWPFFIIIVVVVVVVDSMKNALKYENRIKYHLFCLNVIHRNRMQWCCSLLCLTHRVMKRRQQVESITLTLMTTNVEISWRKKDNEIAEQNTSLSHLNSRRISMWNGSTNTYACMLFLSLARRVFVLSFAVYQSVCISNKLKWSELLMQRAWFMNAISWAEMKYKVRFSIFTKNIFKLCTDDWVLVNSLQENECVTMSYNFRFLMLFSLTTTTTTMKRYSSCSMFVLTFRSWFDKMN